MNSLFLIVNVRSYLYNEELLKLARAVGGVTGNTRFPVYFICSYADLRLLREHTRDLIITAQFMDSLYPGRGMGHVLLDTLKAIRISAVFLNHTENPETTSGLCVAIKQARELGIAIIVCANSTVEAKVLACMDPDILLTKPTDPIGTGIATGDSYVVETARGIKEVSPHILATVGSGINTAGDHYNVIRLGADGTGATSDILKASSPEFRVKEMAKTIVRA